MAFQKLPREELKMLVYQKLAHSFVARENSRQAGKVAWQDHWEDEIESLVQDYLPTGSGIDAGVKFDFEKSSFNRLVLNSSFHIMDENGFYDGWVEFRVVVKPSLAFGINVDVKGKFGNHQDIKDYLGEIFREALTSPIKEKEVV
jgi:hypothetical protein